VIIATPKRIEYVKSNFVVVASDCSVFLVVAIPQTLNVYAYVGRLKFMKPTTVSI
jgi:hypothetical protein